MAVALALLAACGGDDVGGGTEDGGVDGDGSPEISDAGPPPGSAVFDVERLHEIEISVDESYLDQLENDRENRVPCTFTFDGVVVEQTGIRQKGGYGSSSNLDGKPGFSVKFDEFVDGARLDGLKKVVLNNAQEDPTFVSEHIGYHVHRAAGLAGSLTSHAIVTLNERVYGIYVVKEPIADDFLERNFGADSDTGNVYEGFYHPEDQSLGDFVTHPEELDLKDEVSEMRSRDDVIALADAIASTSDDAFEAAVSARLDLDRAITSFAVDALLGYWDSYAFFLNNYFLYHDPKTDRFVYLPHGMDQLQYDGFDRQSYPMGALLQRVRDIPALEERYQSELARLIDEAWDVGALHERIDRVGEVLHSTTRDDERVLQDLDSFDANVEGVKSSIASRAE